MECVYFGCGGQASFEENTLKIVSLFSGAGGLDLGLIQAGHEIVWANDFDADCVDTYQKNINNDYN